MGTKTYYKSIIVIALPLVISMMINPIVGMIDTKMLGFKDNALWLAGLAVAALTYAQIIWFFSFLFIGTLSLTSVAIGMNDKKEVKAIFYRNATIGLILAIAVTIFHPVIFRIIFTIINPEAQIIDPIKDYLNIRIYFFFIPLFSYMASAWLLANKKSLYILVYDFTFGILTIGFNILFVIILDYNIKGIAIGTVLAELGSFVVLLYILCKKTDIFQHFSWRVLKEALAYNDIIRIFKVNGHLFVRTLCLISIFMLFNRFSTGFIDTNIIAANGIILQILLMLTTSLEAFGDASSTLIGRSLGQKKYPQIYTITKDAFVINGLLGIMLSFFIYMNITYIGRFFTHIPMVIENILAYKIWFLILPIPMIIAFTFDGIILGLKEIKHLRNASIFAALAFGISYYILPVNLEVHRLWIAFLLSFIARGLYLYAMFIKVNRGFNGL
ncbi:MAG: MATE family efflux transporter [Alphaproteobacteria bacterium]